MSITRAISVIVAILVGVVASFGGSIVLTSIPAFAFVVLTVSIGALVAGILAPFAATWAGLGVGVLNLLLAVLMILAMTRHADLPGPIMTPVELMRAILAIGIGVGMANLGAIARKTWAAARER